MPFCGLAKIPETATSVFIPMPLGTYFDADLPATTDTDPATSTLSVTATVVLVAPQGAVTCLQNAANPVSITVDTYSSMITSPIVPWLPNTVYRIGDLVYYKPSSSVPYVAYTSKTAHTSGSIFDLNLWNVVPTKTGVEEFTYGVPWDPLALYSKAFWPWVVYNKRTFYVNGADDVPAGGPPPPLNQLWVEGFMGCTLSIPAAEANDCYFTYDIVNPAPLF